MELRAAFGRAEITPKLGCRLMGYGNRASGATAVHDPLFARLLVIEVADTQWALISCEFCYLNVVSVQEIRSAIAQQTGIAPTNVFLATTHTHSGPSDRDADNWARPLAEIIAEAVKAAVARLEPAQLASGYGMLYGYSINRRWIDRPVDPGLGVIRIDNIQGQTLGLVTNFACHAVVMGPDNLQVSADWPGYACTKLEAALGHDATCLFLQGGAGNINPLVAGVRQALQSGRPVVSIGDISAYYGPKASPERYNVGNRTGGTFAEVAELGEAFATEVLHIYQGLQPAPLQRAPWTEQIIVKAIADHDETVVGEKPSRSPTVTDYELLLAAGLPAEIMLFQLGDALLVGQPAEVFSETAVQLKRHLRALGYPTPMLVSYANGWLSYLPEPEDFPEGGYEVGRAYGMGSSRYFQPRVRAALEPVFQHHAPSPSV
ncbi:MAG: neutral/alkaline non-lysosomal ceramidase N-terminal domain-containing protein [Caldilineaceae bacterium]|nr:neutral/alkaline non-lysosomal ceramidase N-terminal domain-containing protein [Caldilineaceae bacterium]